MKLYYFVVILTFLSSIFAIDENFFSTNQPSFASAVYNLIPPDLFLKVYDTNFTPDDVSEAFADAANLFVGNLGVDMQEEYLEFLEAMRNAFIRGISPLTYFSIFMNTFEDYMKAKNIILTPDNINELTSYYYKLFERNSDPNGPIRNTTLKMPFLHVIANTDSEFYASIGARTPEDTNLIIKLFINNINNA